MEVFFFANLNNISIFFLPNSYKLFLEVKRMNNSSQLSEELYSQIIYKIITHCMHEHSITGCNCWLEQ